MTPSPGNSNGLSLYMGSTATYVETEYWPLKDALGTLSFVENRFCRRD